MTKDEKDSVDIETSQMDDPVDSQPQVEHEGLQNQPTENLPQQSAHSGAGGSQSCSGGREEDVNVIREENEDLIGELPDQAFSEGDRSSTYSEFYWITALRGLFRGFGEYCMEIRTECRALVKRYWDYWIVPQAWLFVDNVKPNFLIVFIYFVIASFSLGFGLTIREYLDFAVVIFCVSTVTIFLNCFEKCAHYSKVSERLADQWPCISECCVGLQIPHSPNRFYRSVPTRFEHEVADAPQDGAPIDEAPPMVYRNEDAPPDGAPLDEAPPMVYEVADVPPDGAPPDKPPRVVCRNEDAPPDEEPRIGFRNKESDLSHSSERSESSKEVKVSSNVEFPEYSEELACGYTSPEKVNISRNVEFPGYSEELPSGCTQFEEFDREKARRTAREEIQRDASEDVRRDASEDVRRDASEDVRRDASEDSRLDDGSLGAIRKNRGPPPAEG